MERSAEYVKDLVQQQLSSIHDPLVRQALADVLITPAAHWRNWDYGSPGEKFQCWTLATHGPSDTSIVYCDEGFGPEAPWGLVSTSDLRFGMDSGWFRSLRDCFIDSFMAADLPIWRVVRDAWAAGEETLHRNLVMDEAFRLRDALAQQAKDAKFHVLPRPDEAAV